jgi:preprotein translocase subunit SecA
MVKIREGVTLRSLEQRSPLNIYVEEADKFFTQMKHNISYRVITRYAKIYVPNIQNEL